MSEIQETPVAEEPLPEPPASPFAPQREPLHNAFAEIMKIAEGLPVEDKVKLKLPNGKNNNGQARHSDDLLKLAKSVLNASNKNIIKGIVEIYLGFALNNGPISFVKALTDLNVAKLSRQDITIEGANRGKLLGVYYRCTGKFFRNAPDWDSAWRMAEAVADKGEKIFETFIPADKNMWRSFAVEAFIPYAEQKIQELKEQLAEARTDYDVLHAVDAAEGFWKDASRFNEVLPQNVQNSIRETLADINRKAEMSEQKLKSELSFKIIERLKQSLESMKEKGRSRLPLAGTAS